MKKLLADLDLLWAMTVLGVMTAVGNAVPVFLGIVAAGILFRVLGWWP